MQESLQSLARTHYENFPVGSYFLPRKFRVPIRLVYAFARVADDIADEGDETMDSRLQRLDGWEEELNRGLRSESENPFFVELGEAIRTFRIPPSLFSDLITAYRMDARGTGYRTFDELLIYCRHSANPVGRILLHIFGCIGEESSRQSDAICTALQLTNFWQDLSVDIKRNRDYIPASDIAQFGLTKEALRRGSGQVGPMVKFQIERTRRLFLEGSPLLRSIDRRFSFELRLTYHGGMRILEKVESLGDAIISRRPSLSKYDWALVFARSFLNR